MKNYEKLIEKCEEDFWKSVNIIAQQAFEEEVKPYLAKHKLCFLSGNNDWTIHFTSETSKETMNKLRLSYYLDVVDYTKLPKKITEVLFLQVGRTDLGTCMPSYNYENHLGNGNQPGGIKRR
jgi:hypothetical protein